MASSGTIAVGCWATKSSVVMRPWKCAEKRIYKCPPDGGVLKLWHQTFEVRKLRQTLGLPAQKRSPAERRQPGRQSRCAGAGAGQMSWTPLQAGLPPSRSSRCSYLKSLDNCVQAGPDKAGADEPLVWRTP